MVGRVGPEPAELLRIVGGAVLRNPQPGDQKPVVAQHVQQRNLNQHRAEQLGPLGERRAHEKPAVGASGRRQALGPGVPLADQPLGGADEVVEAVLLVCQDSGLMPALTILSAAPDVGNSDDAAVLQPQQQRAGEGRRHADVEPAIAGEIGGVVSVCAPVPCGAPETSRSGCRPWRDSSPARPRIWLGSMVASTCRQSEEVPVARSIR